MIRIITRLFTLILESELQMQLFAESKMSKAKTMEIEKLTREKEGKLSYC